MALLPAVTTLDVWASSLLTTDAEAPKPYYW
jgi:hypothetical protein